MMAFVDQVNMIFTSDSMWGENIFAFLLKGPSADSD